MSIYAHLWENLKIYHHKGYKIILLPRSTVCVSFLPFKHLSGGFSSASVIADLTPTPQNRVRFWFCVSVRMCVSFLLHPVSPASSSLKFSNLP